MKQVIVIRKDLKMRRGKECAQAAHAAMAFLLSEGFDRNDRHGDDANRWIHEGQTKICVSVDSLEELMTLHEQARKAGLRSHYITDAGRTEFNGVATITCLAIGPDWDKEVDAITGKLKLY